MNGIFLPNNWVNSRWPTGSRDGGNKNVETNNVIKENPSICDNYKFIIRKSGPGTGAKTEALQSHTFTMWDEDL